VAVPAQYIKDAHVDWRLEFMQAAGQPLAFGTATIPAPTFGVWAMLELCDCDFVHPHKEPTPMGAVMAAYIAAVGEPAAEFVNAYVTSSDKPTSLEDCEFCPLMSRALAWALSVDMDPDKDYSRLAEWLYAGFAGFQMIPGGEGGGSQLFGVDALGSMVAGVGAPLGVSWRSLMWETPLVVVGHVVAQQASQNGTKGVARPKDKKHMLEMFALERECRESGKLYPWQEDHPTIFGPDGHESPDEYYRLAELTCKAKENASG
jgi:hypothetical protein